LAHRLLSFDEGWQITMLSVVSPSLSAPIRCSELACASGVELSTVKGGVKSRSSHGTPSISGQQQIQITRSKYHIQ
jgi:hypothetical protein